MNIHTPERQPNESQADYRARQLLSKRAVKRMAKGPTQSPAINGLDMARFFLGQHTNQPRNAQRAQMKALGGKRQMGLIQRDILRNERAA